jgi:hypothetical protein
MPLDVVDHVGICRPEIFGEPPPHRRLDHSSHSVPLHSLDEARPDRGEIRLHLGTAPTRDELDQAIGMTGGKPDGDCAAEPEAHEIRAHNAELIPQPQQIADEQVEGVGRFCRIRAAMSAQVEAQNPKIPIEERHLAIPDGEIVGDSRDERDPRGPVPAIDLVVQASAVDVGVHVRRRLNSQGM